MACDSAIYITLKKHMRWIRQIISVEILCLFWWICTLITSTIIVFPPLYSKTPFFTHLFTFVCSFPFANLDSSCTCTPLRCVMKPFDQMIWPWKHTNIIMTGCQYVNINALYLIISSQRCGKVTVQTNEVVTGTLLIVNCELCQILHHFCI